MSAPGAHPSAVMLDPVLLCHCLEDAHVGIFVTDSQASVVCANGFARQRLDLSPVATGSSQSLLDKNWQHDAVSIQKILGEAAASGHWTGEIQVRHRDGVLHRQTISLAAQRNAAGQLIHYLGLVSNDSLEGLTPQQARNIAHFDALTGLPNRLLLNDRLDQAIAVNRRNNTLLAVCFMDLDGFKEVNDTLGHAAGDLLLKFVASRMQCNLRDSDTVARVGGDEFVMLLSGLTNEDECRQALNRLLSEVAEPYLLDDDQHAEITLSIGVAIFPVDESHPTTLLQHADQAMYTAKKAGKNRFQMFDSRLEERMQARQQMLARVAKGLGKHEFSLHYQPIVDVATPRVIGLEALIRWQHPILGALAPAEFIPLIEDDELSRHVGLWVLETALRQAREWHQAGIELPLSINVFSRQMLSMDFPKLLKNAIAECWPDLPAGRIQLEIQECASPLVLPRLQESILACRQLGFRIALDDFGIGNSSINSLRNLTLDQLKIHQSFAQEMPRSDSATPIIRSILELAHAFKLTLVTEGVEAPETIPHLQAMGCRIMQGFAIARPMPAAKIADWLAAFPPPILEKALP